MKNSLIIIFVFLSQFLSAQSFFTIGANYSVQSFYHRLPFGKQELENFKLTPSFGYGYRFNIWKNWTYQPRITLGDAGSLIPPDKYTIYALSLNQFVDYKPLGWLSVGLSPTVSYNIYAGITGKSFRVINGETIYSDRKLLNWKNLPSHKLNRFVFSVIPRIVFHLNKQISMDLFYRNDLTSVGYPGKILNLNLRGYGVGANLRYQLKYKNDCDNQGISRKK